MKRMIKDWANSDNGLLSCFHRNHRYELFTTEQQRQKHIEKWAKNNPQQKDFCAKFFHVRKDDIGREYYFIAGSGNKCLLAEEKKW